MNIKNNFRMQFSCKKLSDAFLFLFGALLVIGLFMLFYINNYHPYKIAGGLPRREEIERLRKIWAFMPVFFRSMIISGIIGIIFSTPLTILLGRRLKSLKFKFIIQEYDNNKDSFEFQRNTNKRMKPISLEIRIIPWGDFV
ncbi:MAG: hypothetical protein ACW98A_15245 [Candidatus Hodarchaeales archaeon]|jgi:hypothetical protein